MTEEISEKLSRLPTKSGIYQFFNDKKKLLYIGKAKNLKNRVKSYFASNPDLTPSKQRMVAQITDIEYTVVDNETEALLLETTLIKEHKPPYNVILKDDKYWQYIVIDYENEWPQIYSTRRPNFVPTKVGTTQGTPNFKKKSKSIYYGPYTSGYAVKETLRLIKKIFPVCLKLPKKPLVRRSLGVGGCFNYHLGRCLGPCVGKTTPSEYSKIFDDIKKIIIGNQYKLIVKLTDKMHTFSDNKHFEAAARVRDQIKALKKLRHKQKVVSSTNENLDLISLYLEGKFAAINLFKVRQGKLLDKFNSLIKQTDASEVEIIESFISQYYASTSLAFGSSRQATDLPSQIITAEKLNLVEIFNIPIKRTQRGKKLQLIKLGSTNAKEFIKQQETFFDCETKQTQDALKDLQKTLNLKNLPKRIETYDISNIQGKFAVGAMVVFVNAEAKKSDYRKFKIKLKMTPDDPAMMREVLNRRLRYITSHPEFVSEPVPNSFRESNPKIKQIPKQVRDDLSFKQTPDLIVIDGGITQLNSVLEIMRELEIKIPVISLAKKQEEIYMPASRQGGPDQSKTIKLSKSSPALQLLQRGRDEAHRFAIFYYRSRHKKELGLDAKLTK